MIGEGIDIRMDIHSCITQRQCNKTEYFDRIWVLHFYTIPAKVLSKGDNQMSDPIPYYQCIIPPYMLRNIVENGTPQQ